MNQLCKLLIKYCVLLIFGVLPLTHVRADLQLQFDTTYDTNGFFSQSANQAALLAAGSYFGQRITDSLSAISPGGPNSWTVNFDNPQTGSNASIANLSVPADTLVIFVGARDLGGSTVGQAGPGGWNVPGSASPAFANTVETRGQGDTRSPDAVDFGPWGGFLSLDVDTTWHTDVNSLPASGTVDMFSVLLHEIGHILGFGTSDSWNEQVSGTTFSGANAGTQTLTADGAHWQNGTMSTVFELGGAQEAAMDPSIDFGSRKLFTNLDMAGLQDIGWQVQAVPEPSSMLFVGLCVGLCAVGRRFVCSS
ncbi:MAG: matrixin family metalloprotease [Planctomycetales bacterium]|nr:matrixin family metalloprotease [Planctomycetales bacterium]